MAVLEGLEAGGYDYIELSMAHVAALTDEAFTRLKNRLDDSSLCCEACNNFFPPDVRLTGPNADLDRALEYVTRATARAAQLGVETIVFGSSGAKNVPDGFPQADAWRQVVDLLRAIDPIVETQGITVAIEPLNRIESNLVNTVEDGLRLAREVDRGHIRLLVDYYHFRVSYEPVDVLREAGEFFQHIHFARPLGRVFPTVPDEEYVEFLAALKNAGYNGRLSVEAYSDNFESDAPRALGLLREIETQLD